MWARLCWGKRRLGCGGISSLMFGPASDACCASVASDVEHLYKQLLTSVEIYK